MIVFHRDGDWWDFWIGRLCVSRGSIRFPDAEKRRIRISEAPGYWYIEWLDYQIAWKRKWIVWGDHPFKGRNIRLYDQFGTFAKKATG